MKMNIRLKSVEPVQAGQLFTFETARFPNGALVAIKIESGRFATDEHQLRAAKAYVANIIHALAEETKADRLSAEEIAKIEVPKNERSRL